MESIESGKEPTVTIRAARDGAWADLTVEYSWSPNGTVFSVRVTKYRALSNGGKKGNIKIGLVSKGDTGWNEQTGSGIQDGEWHNFVKTLSVEGNGRSAEIHFNWIYAKPWPRSDINMTGVYKVTR